MDHPNSSRHCGRILQRAFAGEGSARPLGQVALAKDYLTAGQLDHCLAEQKALRSSGEDLRLGHLLIKKGYLTAQQLVEILEDQEAEPDASFTVGNGRYRIRRVVGRGGMGTVYEADDTQLRRTIALKVIREDEATAEMIARLHREAAIMAQLRHPNIVGIHEVGMARDDSGRALHYIAMDFVPGRTLADVIADPASPKLQKLKMLEEAARAVAHAHGQGVLHRDLKPANVLVESGGRVLLTDFGLALARKFGTRLTHSAEVFGTPVYMAPEQVEGKTGEVDERTDVYALGVILYEILTGRLPFQAKSAEKVYHLIMNEDPVRPSRLRHEVDRDLEVVCLKALEKSRARRYAGAGEFAEELARCRRGEPIHARPPSWSYRFRKQLARRRAGVAVALLAIVATAAALTLVWTVRRAAQIRESLDRARTHEQFGRWEEAREEYRSVLRLDARHEEARAAVGRISADLALRFEAARAREAAREEALRLLEKARPALETAREYLYEPDVRYEQLVQHVTHAQRYLTEAIEKSPELAAGHYLMGRSWEILGWWDRSEACLRKSLELDPKLSPARFCLGRLLLEQAYLENYDWEELPDLRRGPAEERAEEAGREIALSLQEGTGFDDELQADLAALCLAAIRNDPQIAALARSGASKYPKRGGEDFHLMLAITEIHLSHRVEALDRALAIRPRFAPALYERGKISFRQGQPDASLRDFNAVLEISPRFYWAYDARATLYRTRGDSQTALADSNRALDIQPASALILFHRGTAYLDLSNYEAAIRDFTQALSLRPRFPQAFYKRGVAHHRMGKPNDAVADFTEAIRGNPDDVKAYVSRAKARVAQGSYPEAIEDAARAVEMDPKFEPAYLALGSAHVLNRNAKRAAKIYDRAIEQGLKTGMIYWSRAMARLNFGERAGAAEDARMALTLDLSPRERKAVEKLLRDLSESP